MGCFDYFKEKLKYKQQRRSTPISATTSNHGTSRSTDSGAGKQTSKSSGSSSSQRSIPALYEEKAQHLRVFDLKELRNATNDFSRLLKIGEGGFGSVYKGLIKPFGSKKESTIVAVKKLNQNGLQVMLVLMPLYSFHAMWYHLMLFSPAFGSCCFVFSSLL